jgi:hypothetical protein
MALAVPLEDQLLVFRSLIKSFPGKTPLTPTTSRKNETAFVRARLLPNPVVQNTKDGDKACPHYCAGGSQYINCGASYMSQIQFCLCSTMCIRWKYWRRFNGLGFELIWGTSGSASATNMTTVTAFANATMAKIRAFWNCGWWWRRIGWGKPLADEFSSYGCRAVA